MPSIQVTAVSTGADTLTAVAHGLTTGDRFVLRNVGGALPAATPALAAVTTYFARRVDADTIQIAETSGAAMAGTPLVNITGVGTGTHFVEHSLPYCENRVAAPGAQVFSEDNNETWAALLALYRLLTGQAQAIWSAVNLAVDLKHGDRTEALPGCAFAATSGWSVGSGKASSTGSGNGQCALPLKVGDRLKSVTFQMTGNATVDMQADINKQTSAIAGDVSIGNNSQNDVPASNVTMTVNVTSPAALAAGESVYLNVFANASGLTVSSVRYTFDRP